MSVGGWAGGRAGGRGRGDFAQRCRSRITAQLMRAVRLAPSPCHRRRQWRCRGRVVGTALRAPGIRRGRGRDGRSIAEIADVVRASEGGADQSTGMSQSPATARYVGRLPSRASGTPSPASPRPAPPSGADAPAPTSGLALDPAGPVWALRAKRLVRSRTRSAAGTAEDRG